MADAASANPIASIPIKNRATGRFAGRADGRTLGALGAKLSQSLQDEIIARTEHDRA